MIDFSYSIAGAITGLLVGLTGVGGGVLMTPILLLLFKTPVTQAVGTDLWFAAITKIVIIYVHNKNQQINWQIAERLWLGSIPISIFLTVIVANGYVVKIEGYIILMVAIIVLITSIYFLFSDKVTSIKLRDTSFITKIRPIATVISGVMLGTLVSLTSVGSGVVGSVILICFYSSSLTTKEIIATEIAHAIPLAIVAGTGYLIFGKIDVHMLISLLIGSIPLAIIGVFLNKRINNKNIKTILASILFCSGMKLLI